MNYDTSLDSSRSLAQSSAVSFIINIYLILLNTKKSLGLFLSPYSKTPTEPPSIQDDATGEQSANVHITTILIYSENHIFHLNLYEYYECFFIAVWIIIAAEKDEARPDKKTGRAVHYNRSWSRWRTDRSRSCCQKIHKTIWMYCQGPHPDQLQAL